MELNIKFILRSLSFLSLSLFFLYWRHCCLYEKISLSRIRLQDFANSAIQILPTFPLKKILPVPVLTKGLDPDPANFLSVRFRIRYTPWNTAPRKQWFRNDFQNVFFSFLFQYIQDLPWLKSQKLIFFSTIDLTLSNRAKIYYR